MDEWFNTIAAGCELPASALEALSDVGFIVLPGPVPTEGLADLARAYDEAAASAVPADIHDGSTTTRINDFVNRGPLFDKLYLHRPILDACCHVIGGPFKLSNMIARTLRAGSPAQDIHADFEYDQLPGWPMVGFIIMVDEFRADNGATRFVPGSHYRLTPADYPQDRKADYPGQVLACGPAGSIIIYNGSTWHGHTANSSGAPRRSIQGAYIRREAQSGANLPERMLPETIARIDPLARYLLTI